LKQHARSGDSSGLSRIAMHSTHRSSDPRVVIKGAAGIFMSELLVLYHIIASLDINSHFHIAQLMRHAAWAPTRHLELAPRSERCPAGVVHVKPVTAHAARKLPRPPSRKQAIQLPAAR
jgi:hypothetical protein